MNEKRIFERIEAPMKIKYEVIDQPPKSKNATSEDISGGGIRLSLGEELKVEAKLKLEIELPEEKNKVITVYGRVAWVKKIEIKGTKTGTYYETGIQFTKSDPLSIGMIFKYFSGKIQ